MKSVYQFTVLAMCLVIGAQAAPHGEDDPNAKMIFPRKDWGCFPESCAAGAPCCYGTCDPVTKKCPKPPQPPQKG